MPEPIEERPEHCHCTGIFPPELSATHTPNPCGCQGYRGHQISPGYWSRCENQFVSQATDPPGNRVTCGHERDLHCMVK